MNQIDTLFNPNSIAVVGASQTPGKIGHTIVKNIIDSGYKGAVFPINPSGADICGLTSYAHIEDIQDPVDIACTVVPARIVPETVLACARKGVKYNLIITSGFSEIGNIEEEKKLTLTAREHGMRIIGPNIFGLYSADACMDATFGPGSITPGSVAIITQSGALGLAMIGKTAVENIGLSAIVSVGNKCDIDESDLLEYLVQQQRTKVILMYIEGIKHGERFINALKKATRIKPVIVIKSGRSARGAAAAASHTGSLAGADEIVDAILKQCGALRADSIAEAFSWCAYLAHAPEPTTEQTVIITNGGGVGVMATDACERFDIPLYNDSETLRDSFAPVTPSFGSTKNPIDITGGATAPEYSQALDVVLNHDKIGAAMALYCETAVFPARDLEIMLEETSRRFDEHKRPVLFAAVGGEDLENTIARLRRINVPVFPDVDQAVACMGKLFEHYRQRRYRSDTFEDCVIDTPAIDAVTAQARTTGRSFLSADEARAIMQIVGISMPVSCVVRSLDEALKRCDEIGYPLVMKVVSPDIIHKSDAGGVVLDLHDKDEVLDAWQAIMQRCQAYLPGARIDGIELSSMIEPGVETIIGARRDPTFGPIAMFGQGGIYVEVMKDVSFRALPLNRLEILRMMKQTRTYPLLLGVRGESKKDIEGVLETIIKIGALVRAVDYISDIEINPLVVFEENAGVKALDVRILLGTQGKGTAMTTLIIASLRANAGKTSMIVGLTEHLKRPVGYMKPFGDRLLYSKKRLWDYDAALMSNLYAFDRNPEHMSIGFDHAKIRYTYTGDALRSQLEQMAEKMGRDNELLFIECGRSIPYGSGVQLDPLSIARVLKAPLVVVASGGDEDILDDIIFLRREIDLQGIELAGIIINGVNAVDSFQDLYLPEIEKQGIQVLGIVPHRAELGYYSLRFLADKLFAKVLTCERNLGKIVKHIFIGAMAGDTALQKPFFRKSDKLIITGGDRTDMILAAIESNSAGILLTNNILPPANILARVEESGIPMLLANTDTNEAARRIAGLQPLLTIEDRERIELLRDLVGSHINIAALTG